MDDNVEIAAAKPITVIFALRRMWELIADDRWVVIVAFGALVIAAVRVLSNCLFCTDTSLKCSC